MRTRTLAATLLLAVLALTGCAGTPTTEPTTTVTPWSKPIDAAPATPKPTPTPTSSTYAYTLSCYGDDYKRVKFADYRAVWESDVPMIRCESDARTGNTLSEAQSAALIAAYGSEKTASLDTLYSLCGDLHTSHYGTLPTYSASQIAEIRAALTLCPDHPGAADILARIDASALADEQRAAGIRFGGGIRQVGVDIEPGTYVTEGNIDGCYWEKLDAAGNIIDNNFLGSALRVEVTIYESDFSFSSTSCGEWVRQ